LDDARTLYRRHKQNLRIVSNQGTGWTHRLAKDETLQLPLMAELLPLSTAPLPPSEQSSDAGQG